MRLFDSCISHHITYNFKKYSSSYSFHFCFLTFQRPERVLKFRSRLYLTCESFCAWCTVSEAPGITLHSFLLPSSSSLSPLISSIAPSFLDFSSRPCLLHSLLPSLFSPAAWGFFMKAALIWGNQYLHYMGCRGAGQRLGGAVGVGWQCGGGACLCVGGGNVAGMLLNKRKPIELSCTSLCVCEGPRRLLRAWLTGSELVLGLRGGLSVCVCVSMFVCKWGYVSLVYKLYKSIQILYLSKNTNINIKNSIANKSSSKCYLSKTTEV